MLQLLEDGTGAPEDIGVALLILTIKNLEKLRISVLDQHEQIVNVVSGVVDPQDIPEGAETLEDARPGPTMPRLRVLVLENWEGGRGEVPMQKMWLMLKPLAFERFEGLP